MNLLNKFLSKVDFDSYEEFARESKIVIPEHFNFGYDVVDEYARVAPDKCAVVWCNNKGEEKSISFGELKTLSDKVVTLLLSLGLKKGDVFMTMLNRRYEYWIIAVACHKLGVVLLPATFMLRAKDIIYRVNNAEVKGLIVTYEQEVLDNVQEAMSGMPENLVYLTLGDSDGFQNFHTLLDNAEPCAERFSNENQDEFLIYFTSGTTGYPKMVSHNYLYPLGHIYNAYYWQCVKDDGLHYTVAETGWAKNSWGSLYGQWIAGTAIFAYDYFGKFSPIDLLPLVHRYHITTFCAPPTIYRFLIKEDLTRFDLSSIEHASTAGEPLNPEVWRQFYDATGLGIREGFGQTESAIILGTFRYIEGKLGSMGKPCPLYEIHLIDDDYNDVPQGAEGEVAIKIKPNQCSLVYKYHNDEQRTKECLGDGWHHTGDLAYCDEEGYFWFVSRKDDVIKSSGYRIGPFEVESALLEHPSVLECAITGVPDPKHDRGQIIKATIVLANGFSPSEELKKELQQHVKESTAPYKYPRIIEFVDELPKTISGKIRHAAIRKKDN